MSNRGFSDSKLTELSNYNLVFCFEDELRQIDRGVAPYETGLTEGSIARLRRLGLIQYRYGQVKRCYFLSDFTKRILGVEGEA